MNYVVVNCEPRCDDDDDDNNDGDSLLVKSPFDGGTSRCRQCYTDFLLQCAGDIEADHTDSGIAMDSAD